MLLIISCREKNAKEALKNTRIGYISNLRQIWNNTISVERFVCERFDIGCKSRAGLVSEERYKH